MDMHKRFTVQTNYHGGDVSVASFDSYREASSFYLAACNDVTWSGDAWRVRMIDKKQSTADTEHILHLCTTNTQY